MSAMSDLTRLEASASEIAQLLKPLANERRIRLLLHLEVAGGEMAVEKIAVKLGIGQSALSQHLAKLRKSGVITARRAGHKLFYRITDAKAAALVGALRKGLEL